MTGVEETEPVTVLDHVRLDVADVDVSERFYRQVLGLHPVVRYELPDRILLQLGPHGRPGGIELWQEVGLDPSPHPTHHVAFRVDDVSALVERARRQGYSVISGSRRISTETVAILADPDGHLIELNDFLGRPAGGVE
jgi:catechol 2,3-dioxygenase-like lactoylglutathione lyase family enzyme